jgi:hypothetical protein
MLGRVLGFCALLSVFHPIYDAEAETYWPWRRLWVSIWLCGLVEELLFDIGFSADCGISDHASVLALLALEPPTSSP